MTTNDLVERLREDADQWDEEAASSTHEFDHEQYTLRAGNARAAAARLALAEEVVRAVVSGHHTANGEGPNSPAHSTSRTNVNWCDICAKVAAYDASKGVQQGGER